MVASRQAMMASDLVAGYEEVMEKVGPTVRGVVQKEVEEISVSLEERIRELALGYTRLNQLALEAPLGLASLAATHHSRLSSFGLSDQCNDTAIEGWDDQKHREVLWETREAKMLLDANYKADIPSKKTVRALSRVPGAKFSSARPPIFDRERKPLSDSTSPIALRKYRGGFHGEQSSPDPAGPLEQRGHQQRREPRRKLAAHKVNSKRAPPVRIVVKESNADLAKVAKESIGAATAAAKRAAAAAEKAAVAAARAAAQEAPPLSPLLERSTTVLDEPVAEYRIIAPRRREAEMASVEPALLSSAHNDGPGSEAVLPPSAYNDRPALRLDADLYLARPTDASEATPSVARRPGTACCVEPGLEVLEDERVRAIAGTQAVWIPDGRRRAQEPTPTGRLRDPPQSAGGAKHRTSRPAMTHLPLARSDTVFDSPFAADPHSRDCARLVTRIMLAQAQREPHRQRSAPGPGGAPSPSRSPPPTPAVGGLAAASGGRIDGTTAAG